MRGGFKNRTAVVTGGASGIGLALCHALARAGADVVVADLNATGADAAAKAIREAGGRAQPLHVDVTDFRSVEGLVEEVVAGHGQIDYMFNNAGIAVVGEVRDLPLADWRRIIDINLNGVLYGSIAAYRAMTERGEGHIVNTASILGLIPTPSSAPYVTTKHGVVGLSRSLRVEGRALGVRVSAVCPGFIDTGIFDAASYTRVDRADVTRQVPFKLVQADAAARKILKGVRRNRALIVFPTYARVLWWLDRLLPATAGLLGAKAIRDFRKIRAGE